MQKLVEEDSEGPDISLGAVTVVEQTLGSHVDRAADIDIRKRLFRVLESLSEPKVSYFGHPFVHEDVGHLKISVYYPHLIQILQPTEYLINDLLGTPLVHGPSLPDKTLEVPLVAQLSHDVTVVLAVEYLNAVKNIRVFEGLKDLTL